MVSAIEISNFGKQGTRMRCKRMNGESVEDDEQDLLGWLISTDSWPSNVPPRQAPWMLPQQPRPYLTAWEETRPEA